jgi:transcriptional regulator with GAF, ATPase, and Fis domain/tetratricopeptide (TPR) repeat protein
MAEARLNDRYRILRRLGASAHSQVFAAADGDRGDAAVAIKLVGAPGADRDRMLGEFARLSRLSHPQLVRARDLEVVTRGAGEIRTGGLILVTDFIDGVDPVAALRRAGAQRTASLLAIAQDVTSALCHVHAAGLVHGDVKPANIVCRGAGDGLDAVLVDLGLARAPGRRGEVSGSLAYLAPETLGGEVSARADLFALGVTLYEAATGHRPWAGATAAEVLAALLTSRPDPVTRRASWLVDRVGQVIDKLIARDPARRHSCALVLGEDLARAAEAVGTRRQRVSAPAARPPLAPPLLCGREGQVTSLCDLAARVAQGDAAAPCIARVVGPPGAGRRSVIREARRRHQLAVASGQVPLTSQLAGPLDQIVAALGWEPAEQERQREGWPPEREREGWPPEREREGWIDLVVDRLLARATQPVLVWLDGPDDARVAPLLRALAHHEAAHEGLLTVVAPTEDDDGDVALADEPPALIVRVGALAAAEVAAVVASMTGRAPAPTWVEELTRVTAGLPRFVVEATRAAAEIDPERVEATRPSDLLGHSSAAALGALAVRRAAKLDPRETAVLEALAVAGGCASRAGLVAMLSEPAAQTHARVADLGARGLLDAGAAEVALPSAVHAQALYQALPEVRRRALHRAALRWLDAASEPADPSARARHLLAVGPRAAAVDACLAAAASLGRSGRSEEAAELTRRAAERAAGPGRPAVLLAWAERALAQGRYDEACQAAEAAAQAKNPAVRRRAALARARAEQRRGHFGAAEATLRQLHARDDDEEAAGALARLLVTRARYAEAAAIAGAPPVEPNTPIPPGRALRLESAALCALYTGALDRADAIVACLEPAARSAGDRALLGRALGLRGMVAQTRGDVDGAADLYAAAHGEARAAGDVHAAAVYACNRGVALAERGRHGAAIRTYDKALGELDRVGAVGERAAALYNRGIALLAIGELDLARRAAVRARAEAARHGLPQAAIYADLLDGDVARRAGDLGRACAAYQAAARLAAGAGQARERLLCALNLAEAHAEAGDGAAAAAALGLAAAEAQTQDDHDRAALTRARLAVAVGLDPDRAAGDLEPARQRLRQSGRLDLAWRADALAARLAGVRGDSLAQTTALAAAQRTLDEITAATPEADRDGLAADPDAAMLRALAASTSVAAPPPAPTPSASEVKRLRRLLALGRRLNSELRLEPLLDDVIDTVIELTSAERGFLLLYEPGASANAGDRRLVVRVARNLDHTAPDGDELRVSRSIAERAARTGEAVMTVDAVFDERFGAAASVAALRLRSVLAVPLRQKGRIIGTIYLDHRFRRGVFDEEAVAFVLEVADLAAIAIENARLVEENRRQKDELGQRSAHLEREVLAREAELAVVSARLETGAAPLRHPYDAIIGRSAPMVELLRMLDRATETSLPVVILGESGTGKELIARALHDNGARHDRPFVAVNCGAVPDPLLESELFGHVRGAFTGADRDRRGLFEVADGGTLFLDEVADTSLAMQAKLLRVLQEGELRRVGDERARRVDVRIVAASNRSLEELVRNGEFREDFYYRLNVMSVRVPPLRDRIEDIAELCTALLARQRRPGRAPPTLERAALARLCAYPWPGNVRELENELLRALALGGEVLGVADLSPAIAAVNPGRRPPRPEDLRLRPRVAVLERALVEEAMARTSGNQTAAARLLGLSRYGLQKKLRRFGLAEA